MVKITEANKEHTYNQIQNMACWIDIMYMPLQNM